MYIQNSNVNAGESNWPEQFPTEYYIEMLQNPEKELIYWAQHMNMPDKSSKFTKFDVDWLGFWHFENDDPEDEEDTGRVIVLEDMDGKTLARFNERDVPWRGFLDPGGFAEKAKMTKGDSRTAILVGGQPYGTIYKIVRWAQAFRLKNPDVMMDELFRAHKACRPISWRQEVFGQQEYILKDVKLEAKKRGVPLNIVPFEHDTKKDAKDRAILGLVQPMFNREIFIHRSMRDLIAEIRTYPNGITMDLLDMLGQIMKQYWRRGKKEDPEQVNQANASHRRPAHVGRTAGYR